MPGGGDSPYDDPFLNSCCCCCHCFLAISYIFSAFQRCILFFPCYPLFKCFGWNESAPRYQHHHIQHTEME
ncbi:hypothetical protein JHK82_018169 [Glycine max]|uniref:Uncharacterized protein n=2 Tax=Glycine subgen. Soja TaxID=1462606 RepID=K7L1C4_SOYBN|nr:hypothetical protein JHK87_018059 [Glycine soja]KAG5022251.1 hypothetical protein JHK85_018593 [Glycine max]KAG5037354.1 hypothetical protein JHK86_018194 [Glycine max]KAG5142427.1 hypothetical protein JHK82_018122 [Glycine max]KAG5142474.1 hypothetical protein JHK82_018169 [Glycine max]